MARNFLWDPIEDNVIAEFDDDGGLIVEYTTEPELHGDVISQRRDGETNCFYSDGLGSTTEVTNAAGETVATRAYSVFGETTQSSGTVVFPFEYLGENGYYKDALPCYYVRTRIYEPRLSRWTSELQWRDDSTVNPYVFFENTPTIGFDPNRLTPFVSWPYPIDVPQWWPRPRDIPLYKLWPKPKPWKLPPPLNPWHRPAPSGKGKCKVELQCMKISGIYGYGVAEHCGLRTTLDGTITDFHVDQGGIVGFLGYGKCNVANYRMYGIFGNDESYYTKETRRVSRATCQCIARTAKLITSLSLPYLPIPSNGCGPPVCNSNYTTKCLSVKCGIKWQVTSNWFPPVGWSHRMRKCDIEDRERDCCTCIQSHTIDDAWCT